MRTRILAIVLCACAAIIPSRSGAVSLTLGPDGPTSAQDRVAVLYASRADGSVISVARVGDETPDGGRIAELGIPSETPDGRVLFGANIEDRAGQLAWSIMMADPNAAAPDRVASAMASVAMNGGCTPRLAVDPYPVATREGAIAFFAPRKEGGDALFLFKDGRLDCLVRTGDRLADGREIARLAFGTAQAGAGDSIAILAMVKRGRADRAHPTLWWREHLQAVLLLAPDRAPAEIAVEGMAAPRGGTFGIFGPPAAVPDRSGGTVVAFTDQNARGTSLYVYRRGVIAPIIRGGQRAGNAAVRFISQGRPAVGSDGTVAVRGASRDRDLIILAARGGVRVVVSSGQTLSEDFRASNFGDPLLVEGARLYFPACAGDYGGLYEREPTGAMRELGQPAVREAAFGEPHERPRVASPTLTANARGDYAYLGSR